MDRKLTLKRRLNILRQTSFQFQNLKTNILFCSHQFNNTKDTNLISEITNCFLEKINGILRLKFQGFNAIAVDSLFVFEDEQGISKIAAMRATLSGRGDLTAIANSTDEEIGNQNKQTEDLFNNSIATEVFHFYSQPTSWINLYKIYEIIRDDIGDKEIIKILSKNELSRFTGTAQSREQIGDDARHAAKKFIRHPQPMTIKEANELIKKLILEWSEASIQKHIHLSAVAGAPIASVSVPLP